MRAVFDPGLQPERTELAWRRTTLALAVGSLVAVRLLPVELGDPWWAFAGLTGFALAVSLGVGERWRARRIQTLLLSEGDRAPLPGATILFLLAGVATAAGLVALAVVLVAGFSR